MGALDDDAQRYFGFERRAVARDAGAGWAAPSSSSLTLTLVGLGRHSGQGFRDATYDIGEVTLVAATCRRL